MFEILHFRGGVYKFDVLAEFVEDVGGMILNEDRFEIIRGDYFLSNEIHVLLLVPEKELDNVKSLISEIKGITDNVKSTKDLEKLLLSYLCIYDALTKKRGWTDKDQIIEAVKCPCYAIICNEDREGVCPLEDNLEEILVNMHSSGIVEYRVSGEKTEFRLKKIN